MEITFTRTTTYTIDVPDDDDATLQALTEVVTPLSAETDRDSLYEMLTQACQWDTEAILAALVPFADVSEESWESESWDLDGIEPDESEDDGDRFEVAEVGTLA